MPLLCLIMRSNRTIKIKKIGLRKDSFNFEDGVYFVNADRVLLKKGFPFGHRPMLIYKEGISQPLGFNDIMKRKRKIKDEETGKTSEIEDDTVLIDARSLHKLASEHVLGFLTKSSTRKLITAVLIVVIFTLIVTIGVNIPV